MSMGICLVPCRSAPQFASRSTPLPPEPVEPDVVTTMPDPAVPVPLPLPVMPPPAPDPGPLPLPVLPVDPDVLNVELASLLAQPNATVERMPTESKESVEVCTNLMGS